MSNIIDNETTLKVFGFLTEDGIAMGETAYCEEHLSSAEEARVIASEQPDAAAELVAVDVSENEAMGCLACGRNGYGENFWG